MVIQARQTVAGRLHDMEKQKSIILGVFGQIMKTINIHRRSVDQDICSSTVLVQYIIMLFFSHIVPYLDKEFGNTDQVDRVETIHQDDLNHQSSKMLLYNTTL